MFNLNDKYEENFIVLDEVYNGFIQLFKDKNPLHTNEKFAVSKGFNGMVMHGNILNGFLSYFIGECLPSKNVIIHSQNIQYNHAVYLNDEIKFNATVIGVYPSVNAIEFKYEFTNRDATKVAKGKFQIGLLQ